MSEAPEDVLHDTGCPIHLGVIPDLQDHREQDLGEPVPAYLPLRQGPPLGREDDVTSFDPSQASQGEVCQRLLERLDLGRTA